MKRLLAILAVMMPILSLSAQDLDSQYAVDLLKRGTQAPEFSLNDIAHHFLRGHRIMVQIQSSLFPLVAMNPQSFLPNQYEARPEDYKKAEIALNCGPRSYIALSVVD